MYLSSKEYPSGKIIDFNIEAAKKGSSKDTYKIYHQLIPAKELSYGKIFKRKDTDELWFVNPKETNATFLSNEMAILLNKWDEQTLLPNDTQLAILSQIKGLPSSEYSLYPSSVEYPVKAKTKDGEIIDYCICHFSEFPPLQSWFKKIILLSDVVELSVSDLALSHDLRLSSMLSEEIRMSFYPFMLEKVDGTIVTYDGITQFASSGEIKGNEIIKDIPFSYDKFSKIYNDSKEITYIIGKWDSRMQSEFETYFSQLKEIQNSRIGNNESYREIKVNKDFLSKFLSWFKS